MRTCLASSLAALLLPLPALAADLTYCVDSVSTLEDAFDVARANLSNIDKVVIQVVQGTYDISFTSLITFNSERQFLNQRLELLGGFSAGCGSRVLNAANTRLRNLSPTKSINWEPLQGIVFSGFHLDDFGNRIRIAPFTVSPVVQHQVFSHLRFTGGREMIVLGAEAGAGTSLIEAKNIVVWDRDVGVGDDCALRISGDTDSGANVRAVVANVTVAANSGAGLCFGQIDQPEIYNVISYGNSGADLMRIANDGNGAVSAWHSLIGSIQNIVYASNVAPLSSDPQFQNLLTGDLRLQNGSPAINSGYIEIPYGPGAVDVAGLTRAVGLAIDRGAHESLNSGLFALTVTSTADSGANTLRAAIEQANATPGPNAILFNLGVNGCPRVIELDGLLPSITETLYIDGSSQPGFVPASSSFADNGTRCVAVLNASGSPIPFGLQVPVAAAANTRLTVEGLAMGGFSSSAIYLAGGQGHRLLGNRIGGSEGSLALPGSGRGVWIAGPNDVQIGDRSARHRNVIAGISGSSSPPALNAGVLISSSSSRSQVLGNFIGESSAGNRYGVVSAGFSNIISGNVISYTSEVGLQIEAGSNGHEISDNRLGLPPICLLPPCAGAGNGTGMLIAGDTHLLLRNATVNSMSGPGLRISGNDNGVYEHLAYGGGPASAPIDIANAGFSVNGNNGAPNPPAGNRGQNFPVLLSYQREGSSHVVRGTLESANGTYYLQLYASPRKLVSINPPQVRCEGNRLLATASVTVGNAPPGANGSASFAFFLDEAAMAAAAGRSLTALASKRLELNGQVRYGDTSEYGNCLELPLFSDGFEATP